MCGGGVVARQTCVAVGLISGAGDGEVKGRARTCEVLDGAGQLIVCGKGGREVCGGGADIGSRGWPLEWSLFW